MLIRCTPLHPVAAEVRVFESRPLRHLTDEDHLVLVRPIAGWIGGDASRLPGRRGRPCARRSRSDSLTKAVKDFRVEAVAQTEFEEAAGWYEAQRDGFGFEFIAEVDRVGKAASSKENS
jgi:hypothetical protein